jgi:parvulin-like peptidyl-prolyl isomerase
MNFEPRSSLKRLALLLVTVSVVLAACSGSSGAIANVGGTDISEADVRGLVRTDSDEVLDVEFLRYLSVAIQWEAVEQKAFADFGTNPSDEEVQETIDALVLGYNAAATLDEYLEAANASETGIRKYARQLIIQRDVESALADKHQPPTDEEVAAELAAFPADWTEVCSSHILVATAEEAEVAGARLEDGEDFAEIAVDISIDPGSGPTGGDLGCAPASQFVDPFAQGAMAAVIGVPTEPIETEFGFHIIVVSERSVADAQTISEFLDSAARARAVDAWFLEAIDSATVTVDESVGVWVTDPTPQVIAAI